jgi:hypothetical protein
MNLQEKIIALSEYSLGFNIYGGHTIINITYPKEWSVIKPDNQQIAFAQDEVNTETYFYSAPITFNINEIFDCIESTIEFNKEMEKKIKLFQEKQKELESIFIEESYETLLGLTFTYKKKKKQIKNNAPKVVEEEKTEITPTEPISEVTQELSVEEIKGTNKKSKKTKPKLSSHKKNLEIMEGEEICENIIITNEELNNGTY